MNKFKEAFGILVAVFLLLVFSFGRIFSVIHFGYFYVTEIVLLISLPFILFDRKKILEVPRNFMLPFSFYVLLGFLFFLYSALRFNLLALRDVVIFAYPLFLLMSLVLFTDQKRLKRFLWIVVSGNIIGLIFTRICIYQDFTTYPWRHILQNNFYRIRAFNFLLVIGIALSFLCPFFSLVKLRRNKIIVSALIAYNVYMLILWGQRTAWVAAAVLFAALFLSLRNKILKLALYFVPVFLVLSFISVYFLDLQSMRNRVFSQKAKSLFDFMTKGGALRGLPQTQNLSNDDLRDLGKDIKISRQDPGDNADAGLKYPDGGNAVNKDPAPFPAEKETVKVSKEAVNKQGDAAGVGKEIKTSEAAGSMLVDTPPRDDYTDRVLCDALKSKNPKEYIINFSNILWRFDVWRSALRFGMESPILGRGFGKKAISGPALTGVGADSGIKPAHNHLLTIFYKMGLVGLGLFLLLNIYAFLCGLDYLKYCRSEFNRCFLMGCLLSFVFWHSMAFFFDVIDSPPTSFLIWLIMGLIFACIEFDKENDKSTLAKKD